MENLRWTSPQTRGVDSSIYFPRQRALIHKLLSRSAVICAVDPESSDIIWGYLVFEIASPLVVHFVYVKRDFRSWLWEQPPGSPGHYIRQVGKGGIAKSLFCAAAQTTDYEETPAVVTAYTDGLGTILRTRKNRVVVDPYLLHEL